MTGVARLASRLPLHLCQITLPDKVTRTPKTDTTVKDTDSARTHEYNYHFDPAIDVIRRLVEPYERSYRTEADCWEACSALKAQVPDRFKDKVRQTQRSEGGGK